MSKFEKFLPINNPRKLIKYIMIRPPTDLCQFLARKAELHSCTAHKICLAILKAAMEEDKKEIL